MDRNIDEFIWFREDSRKFISKLHHDHRALIIKNIYDLASIASQDRDYIYIMISDHGDRVVLSARVPHKKHQLGFEYDFYNTNEGWVSPQIGYETKEDIHG